MPSLPLPPQPTPVPDTPLDLYERLQVTEPGLSDLWIHQGNALRDYHDHHVSHPDVALELPTGSGKTLVGLLIAEWRRLTLGKPVAYACVNNQLAEHVAAKAERYGISVVLLIGHKREWGAAAATFRGAHAVAITNYHHVFNYWSGVDSAQTLIFDDAHGGEGPVAETWSVTIPRAEEPGLYAAVFAVVSDALTGAFADIVGLNDPRDVHQIELVPPTALESRRKRLYETLAAGVIDGSHNHFALQAIGDSVGRCLVYVSPRAILIRPFIPPTRDLSHVAGADQRLYMSATLGAAGELERAFGVDRIRRLPADTTQQRSGRRLFLMPGLRIDEAPSDEFIGYAISATPRTALIAPSDRELDAAASALLPEDVPRMDANHIAEFVETEPAALLLANRYDGIDLPDKQCRLIVLSTLPTYGHQQERFLYSTLGATQVLTERIRTRVIQGAGRATRNRQDFAAVILRGEDLLQFIQREEARREMRPELQVELELGEYYSRENAIDLRDALQIFWQHGTDWQPTESYIREQVAGRKREQNPTSVALAASAAHEVHAWWSCWQGDLRSAIDAANAAVAQLAGEPLRAYRALWEYFAASWATLLAAERPEPGFADAAARLRAQAEATARMLRWFPRFDANPDVAAVGPDHDARAERAVRWIRQLNTRRLRFDATITEMRDNLASPQPEQFHLGLETLGAALGFEVWRDDHTAACPDAAWRDADRVWLLFEAKTLQNADAALAAKAVREANSHDNWMEAQQGWTPRPRQLITSIVSPRETLGDAADVVADADVALVRPAVIESIGDRSVLAMSHIRGLPAALSDLELSEEVTKQFSAHALDSESLLSELSKRLLRPST